MTIPKSYRSFVDDIHEMIRLSDDDFNLFRKHRSFFENNAEALIGAIASVLMQHAPSRRVFEEGRGNINELGRRLGIWLKDMLDAGDTEEMWHRQFIIGIEHIVRKIPNRQMVGLATRIRELLLPMMLEEFGKDDGLPLYLAFQRLLDSVVALTTTVVEEGQRRCLLEATGFTTKLIDNLQQIAFKKIRDEIAVSQ